MTKDGPQQPTERPRSKSQSESRLSRVVLPLMVVVALQAMLAVGTLEILSAVRAYVSGESLWSRGQKDAIHFITLYAETGNEADLSKFKRAIAIPLADRTARQALEGPVLDLAAARDGFLRGGNHPDDVGALIWLFRYFRQVSYMAKAVTIWRGTDPGLDQLVSLADEVQRYRSGNPGGGDSHAWHDRIGEIDQELTMMAMAFSESLGEGSRAIKLLLSICNVLAAMLLAAFVIACMRRMLASQQRAEEALEAEKEKADVTLASIGDAVIATDRSNHVAYLNPAARRLLKVDEHAVVEGRTLSSLFELVDQPGGSYGLADTSETPAAFSRSRVLVRPDTTSVPVSVVGSQLGSDAAGGKVLVLRDMTAEHKLVNQLSWQAAHDTLTELPNRREFKFQLEQALKHTHRNVHPVSLMYLDLDQFKVVNDTCGHAAGDQLLKQTSALLHDAVAPDGMLARLGGDEFGVLFHNSPRDAVAARAEAMRLAVEESSFVWNGNAFRISVSVGLVHLDETHTVEEGLRAADIACYMAKEKGRNRIEVHNPEDNDLVHRVGEMGWVQKIRRAIEHDEFCLYAQEIHPLSKPEPDHLRMELLLRLRSPDDEVFGPGSFMPAAERYGLIPLIDRWVVRTAFAQLDRQGQGPVRRKISCSINLSGITLGDGDFIGYVSNLFARYRVAPHSICFEITETSAIANIAEAQHFIRSMRELGCSFSLDDFGTGMSSIAYLKHLPVDYIKIDGSFVREILHSEIDRAMVEMIARTARILGKKTIAEFAESAEILDELRKLGVDSAQGYAIGAPRPFAEMELHARYAEREVA